MTAISTVPTAPAAPAVPAAPTVPAIPAVPTAPTAPDAPDAPDAPAVPTVAQHQAQAARLLEFADFQIKVGDYRNATDALERALAHSAAALFRHRYPYSNYPYSNPTSRHINDILHSLAHDGRISRTSARSYRKFAGLRCAINLASRNDDRPQARRRLRNSRRRTSRIIAAINRAIAADPNPITATLFDD